MIGTIINILLLWLFIYIFFIIKKQIRNLIEEKESLNILRKNIVKDKEAFEEERTQDKAETKEYAELYIANLQSMISNAVFLQNIYISAKNDVKEGEVKLQQIINNTIYDLDEYIEVCNQNYEAAVGERYVVRPVGLDISSRLSLN